MCATLGWLKADAALASWTKRRIRSGSAANSAGRIFSATARSSLVSRARYTSPIPPLPNRAVISYEPSCVPMVIDKYKSPSSRVQLRGIYTSVNIRSMEWGSGVFDRKNPPPTEGMRSRVTAAIAVAGCLQEAVAGGCEAFIRESCEAQRRRPRFLNQWPPNAQYIYQGYVNTDFQQWIALLPPHWRSADAVSE